MIGKNKEDKEALILLKEKLQELLYERDYYKSTLEELADRMDFNIIEAYKWKSCAKNLFDALTNYHHHIILLTKYHDHVITDPEIYKKALDATEQYEKLLKNESQRTN